MLKTLSFFDCFELRNSHSIPSGLLPPWPSARRVTLRTLLIVLLHRLSQLQSQSQCAIVLTNAFQRRFAKIVLDQRHVHAFGFGLFPGGARLLWLRYIA